ncbi:MAG TPA: PfkB family carbohydrate kinase [Chloroflexota bacterium]|nr:PfkB family carbohydrate kinase [Chloroflexota bacterium]
MRPDASPGPSRPGDLITPDYLVIGHVTKDVVPGRGYVLGGTVTFSSLMAHSLGRRAAVLTRCQALPELDTHLRGIDLHRLPSDVTTTFENVYVNHRRTQRVSDVALPIPPDAVPEAWRLAPVVHLGPIAQEVPANLAEAFPRGTVIGVTPQGWLRSWDESGRVHTPAPWMNADDVLPMVDVLIFSAEDVGGDEDLVKRYCEMSRLAVVTDHVNGCTVWVSGSKEHHPAFDVEEVDPTGAGDVFATAFLLRFGETRDPNDAARFANCAASFVVQAAGPSGMPSNDQVEERMRTGTLRQTA